MTIKEVAQLAGVSSAAVSRYINGGSLSDQKREKIRKAIELTGYRPNLMARSMRTGRGGQVGVIVPKIHSDSVSAVMAGEPVTIAIERIAAIKRVLLSIWCLSFSDFSFVYQVIVYVCLIF